MRILPRRSAPSTRTLKQIWRHAQDVHAQEHEVGITTTLSCDAVGHMAAIDDYLEYFGRDEQRKFVREYREPL